MPVPKAEHRNRAVKDTLYNKLQEANVFWSYQAQSVSSSKIDDDNLIALTMRYLDLPDIERLFTVFSFRKIKSVWKKLLVPEGEYLFTLNRFFAWYYFKAKRPDSYLKSLQTRHLNKAL